jgi:hypothetical protein
MVSNRTEAGQVEKTLFLETWVMASEARHYVLKVTTLSTEKRHGLSVDDPFAWQGMSAS